MDNVLKIFLVLLWGSYVQSAPRQPRLSLAETPPSYFYRNINGDPNAYSFGYDVSDPETGNTQFRVEERYPNGTVSGYYGYIDAWGIPLRYRYLADENGYRVFQELPTTRPVQPVVQTVNESVETAESSVTWSRPKRPNKKKTQADLLSKIGFKRRNYVPLGRDNDLPSQYIAY